MSVNYQNLHDLLETFCISLQSQQMALNSSLGCFAVFVYNQVFPWLEMATLVSYKAQGLLSVRLTIIGNMTKAWTTSSGQY